MSRPEAASSRRRKLSSIRPDSGTAPGSPNPPASSAGVTPRGSSSSASGLPRVSVTIWSRTRASRGPARADSSSARASSSSRPSTTSSGSPASSSLGARAAKTRPTDSASRRRATNASTCAEARSSHCSSSTTQISGCSSATSESRLSTARPTKKRSGAGPGLTPKAVRSASRCGAGRRSSRSSIGAKQVMQPGEGELHLRLDAGGAHHQAARCLLDQVVQQRGLAHARFTAHHQRPALTSSNGFDEPVEHLAFGVPSP